MNKPRTASWSTKAAKRIVEQELGTTIADSTFYRLIWNGRLDAMRMGSRILIPDQALQEFLARCRRGERF